MRTLLIEYDTGVSVEHLVSYGLKMAELLKSVDSANRRISNNLGIDRNVLSINNGKIKASGVAGVVKLNQDIELEIVPKFISAESGVEWRTTLYLLSALSKHGSIMVNERIKANSSCTDSLYDIAGRMLAEEYLTNKRKPIRKYRKEIFVDYAIDGELDIDSYYVKDVNGYIQTRVRFDVINKYNATIKKAMQIVTPYVSDVRSKNILLSAIGALGPQEYVKGPREKIPSRNKEWEQAYNLSYDIVQGLGASYENGRFYAPGFIANTWQMWEWLVTTSVMLGTTNKKVISQKCTLWGVKKSNEKKFVVNVFPDITVYDEGNLDVPEYLVDAKYKLIENESTGEIERSDLYEAFAFCNGLNTDTIFLAYPMQTPKGTPAGTLIEKSLYMISNIKVYVVMVSFGNIGERGGIYSFSKNFVAGIENILKRKSSK